VAFPKILCSLTSTCHGQKSSKTTACLSASRRSYHLDGGAEGSRTPPSPSCTQKANNGWLQPHQTSAKEIQDLLALEKRDLGDSESDISADWSWQISYASRGEAVVERKDGDPIVQRVGSCAGIDHPEFVLHRTGGARGVGLFKFHTDPPTMSAASVHGESTAIRKKRMVSVRTVSVNVAGVPSPRNSAPTRCQVGSLRLFLNSTI
jgi:hypothetical protein